LPLAVIFLFATLALAACGGGDHDEHDEASTTTVADATSTDGTPNEADVTFAQGMIPHHEQAIEMAEIALDPAVGAGAEVTDLATRIRDAQDPEIETMRGWLAAWGEEEMADMAEDEHAEHGMEGMMSADDLAELEQQTGAAFDRAWLEGMVRHHEGAIAMSETVKTDGRLSEVQALADTIISAQQKEIDEMQGLLDQ
jgi:uncharacterized protein (DUF305 family)